MNISDNLLTSVIDQINVEEDTLDKYKETCTLSDSSSMIAEDVITPRVKINTANKAALLFGLAAVLQPSLNDPMAINWEKELMDDFNKAKSPEPIKVKRTKNSPDKKCDNPECNGIATGKHDYCTNVCSDKAKKVRKVKRYYDGLRRR